MYPLASGDGLVTKDSRTRVLSPPEEAIPDVELRRWAGDRWGEGRIVFLVCDVIRECILRWWSKDSE